ncbi:uncharacterized protein [Clytia hemisphaerica]|uniref:uncharacterized protein n=1 Tax=Clytia hemisphaerica TaxID=252671 RepID=UPI0034D5C805
MNCLNDSDLEKLNSLVEEGEVASKIVCDYVDSLISTCNTIYSDEWVKPNRHACKTDFQNLDNKTKLDDDYTNLLNSVQKHTCSSAYCLRKKKDDSVCRFHFPFDCETSTRIEFTKVHTKDGSEKYRAEIKTKRNDPRLNRHQRVQLQGWRANTDISVIIDYHSCVEYLTKYASKPESISCAAKDSFSYVANKNNEHQFEGKKALKQVMMHAVGQRDMSIQEVCHQILQLKLYSSSFEVLPISLNGSRKVELDEGELVYKPSHLDYYAKRNELQTSYDILGLNFIEFHSKYAVTNDEVIKRKKKKVIKITPNYSPNPKSAYYPLYCKFNLLKYKVWIHDPQSAWNGLEETELNFVNCWKEFLSSPVGQESVPNYVQELENTYLSDLFDRSSSPSDCSEDDDNEDNMREDWMILSDFFNNSDDNLCNSSSDSIEYWIEQSEQFSDSEKMEMPTWINSQKTIFTPSSFIHSENIELENIRMLNKNQLKAFSLVQNHYAQNSQTQLLMIITGQAGCGKSFLINRLRYLLNESCLVTSLFGIAAFNINGSTLHYLLKLPIRNKRNHDLNGNVLLELQEKFHGKKYLIIDEFSVISKQNLAWINRRCKQVTGKMIFHLVG